MTWWVESATGYFSGLRSFSQRMQGVRVLAFHGVCETKTDPILERNMHLLSQFREQIQFLRRLHIVDLAELAETLREGKIMNNTTAAITFDDGYANNMIAAEILQSAGLPWCLFLTAGEVGGNRCIWPVELSLLLLHGAAAEMDWNGKKWDLKGRAQREQVFREVRCCLKALPTPERQEGMSMIRHQFPEGETSRLLKTFPSLKMLCWDQVEQLARSGVEIGSHGWTHEIHHAAQSQQERLHELKESRAEITTRLSRPCRFFAYPNGDAMDDSVQEVRGAGYDLAFTTKSGAVTVESNCWLLPRLENFGSTRGLVRDFFWERRP